MLALFVTQVWLPRLSFVYLYKKLKQISSYEHIIIEPRKLHERWICNQLLSESRKINSCRYNQKPLQYQCCWNGGVFNLYYNTQDIKCVMMPDLFKELECDVITYMVTEE